MSANNSIEKQAAGPGVIVAAFYKFVAIEDPAGLRDQLLRAMAAEGVMGTILVAPEGINATISAAPSSMENFLSALASDPRFADLVVKRASTDDHPFARRKVKLKREIISFRQPGADPTKHAGIRVAPKDWNALIAETDVLLLDTRNDYEIAEGTFAGARDPGISTFTEFADYVRENLDPAVHRKVAMFCTGGIRCEKASAYMRSLGFDAVYQLDGGILNYLVQIPAEESRWHGRCFVFDERVAVDAEAAGIALTVDDD